MISETEIDPVFDHCNEGLKDNQNTLIWIPEELAANVGQFLPLNVTEIFKAPAETLKTEGLSHTASPYIISQLLMKQTIGLSLQTAGSTGMQIQPLTANVILK